MKKLKQKHFIKQKPMQIDVNPNDLPDIKCECGNATFIPGKTIKKLSAILSPDGTAKYIFSEVSVCVKCFKALPPKP